MTELATGYVALEPTLSGKFRRTVTSEVGAAGDTASGSFTRRFGRRAEADASRLGSRVGGRFRDSFSKVLAVTGLFAAAKGALGFFNDSLGEAREAQKVGAVTEQIIKSTGRSANVTAGQVGTLTERLSRKAGVDDELIQSGSNLLLTFKRVRNEAGAGNKIFNRATAAAVDLSAAGFGSITGASKMLGKALNDPIKGIAALGRAGVTFTEGQKSQIKSLVESGRTLEAQKMILREVESQVGGTAAASATAGEKMSVAWGNLKEQLGTAVLPVVDRVATFVGQRVIPTVSRFLGQLQSGEGVGGRFAKGIRTIVDAAVGLFNLIVKGDYGAQLNRAFGWAEDSPIVDALLKIREAVVDKLQPVFDRFIDFLRDNPIVVKGAAIALGLLALAIGGVSIAMGVLAIATSPITAVVLLVAALGAGIAYLWKNSETFRTIIGKVGTVLGQLGGWIKGTVVPAIVDLAQKVATTLRPVWDALVEFFRGTVVPLLGQVAQKFQQWWPTIQRVVAVIAGLIAKGVELWATLASKVLPIVIKVAGFLLRALVPAVLAGVGVLVKIVAKVLDFGGAVVGAGKKITDFAAKVSKKIGDVVGYVKNLPTRAKNALGDLGSLLVDAGRQIIESLWNGLKAKWKDVEDWFGSITSKIPKLKGPPPKDAKLLTPAGKLIMISLIRGLESGRTPLERVLQKVTQQIGSALKRHKISKAAAGQMRAIVQAIAGEANKMKELLAARKELAASTASSLSGEFNLSELTAKNEFGISQGPGAAVRAAQGVVARMRAFAGKISALLKVGMPTALVQEIVGYGSIEGTRVADIFLKASKSERASLRSAFANFNRYTAAVGNVTANAVYRNDIEQLQEIIDKIPDAIRRGLKGGRYSLVIGRRELARLGLEINRALAAQG